ncbi:30S ribosomal protein S20 [Effusibacillus lacus]|uniref:Small ribosomal subunit protein bS20 n=1 Tax=Effusibacillus lacus TaxID=1348429 RepID=A0A292YL60_9BACL|nr:30S ribosomal protein S20 [Effusibacillus lacus]TCS68760.1 small subunit ribosomal protein S20 [Effusibacillus lacus]GAX90678.1 30S ribosomal protein S20 [Effusibacillus lacus]
MPNIKSAIKRVKITRTRTLRNAAAKSALRTAIKKFEVAVANNDLDNAKELLQKATRSLDKAVTKGIIHKNAAARKKSRLTKKFNKLGA